MLMGPNDRFDCSIETKNSRIEDEYASKDTTDLSLRSDAHCNACTDEAHAEPGIARNELSIDVPFPKDGEEEGE
jgi:hypothetical protein